MPSRLPRPLRRRGVLPLLVCVVYAVLQLAAGPQWTLFPDSYRYAKAAETALGVPREEAHHIALKAFCAGKGDTAAEEARLRPAGGSGRDAGGKAERDCLKRWAGAADITTDDPRYQEIFATRPGYPLLAAPFVDAFGVLRGMRLLGLLTAAACSLTVFGMLRGARLSVRAALAGQVVFLAGPLGWWSLQALSEGLFTLCALGVLWGALLLFRRRLAAGTAAMTVAFAAGTVTRYSSVLLLAGLLALAGAAALVLGRGLRHRGTVLLTLVSGAAAGSLAVAQKALGLPSAQITLQDTFTRHFRSPDVPDPWRRLFVLAVRFWRHWLAEQVAMPYFLVLLAVAGWALITYGDGLAWPAFAAAATGVAQITAHPLAQEADRLGVLMWMPVVLGLPLIVERLGTGGRPWDGAPAGSAATRDDLLEPLPGRG